MSSTEKKPKRPRNEKKPFKSPVLQRYGAVRNLTGNVGAHGGPDGGTNPKTKTVV